MIFPSLTSSPPLADYCTVPYAVAPEQPMRRHRFIVHILYQFQNHKSQISYPVSVFPPLPLLPLITRYSTHYPDTEYCCNLSDAGTLFEFRLPHERLGNQSMTSNAKTSIVIRILFVRESTSQIVYSFAVCQTLLCKVPRFEPQYSDNKKSSVSPFPRSP